ncbi:MAG TPA: hypothetical protein VLT33_06005 [Labilithrix sp.]|nr:hypothetical protein [Labilithrix sp.]
MKRGRLFLLGPLAVAAAVTALFACSSPEDSYAVDGLRLAPSSANGGSCATPNEGCPCETAGQVVSCGEVSGTTSDGRATCAMGSRRCLGTTWSRCDALDKITSLSPRGLTFASGAPEAGPDTCSKCDPYCQQSAQAIGGGGATAADAGVTAYDAQINGPPAAPVTTILADAGISLDGAFYHELTPSQTATDSVTITTSVNSVDVYFMLNSTVAASASINQLAAQIPTVVSTMQASIPNVAFGLGRFTNYQSWPYASQSNGNTVYTNMQSISTTAASTVSKIQAMPTNSPVVCSGSASCFQQTPYVTAQSTMTALYAMATNQPLYGWAAFKYPSAQPTDWWWNVYQYYGQRSDAASSPYFAATTCAAGTAGAPCFRANAFHIVLVMQDAPSQNGPAGSFPYYQMKPQYFPWNVTADYTTENAWYWFNSASLGGTATVPKLPVVNGATQALSLTASQVGKPQVQTGNVAGKTNNYQITPTTAYDPSARMKCTPNGVNIGTGPDVAWDFTVTSGTRYWFDSVGSSYDTLLYVIDRNSGLLMACSDDNFGWLSAQAIGGLPAATQAISALNSSILGDLPPGDYRLVLDKRDNTAMPATPSNTGIYEINMWTDIDDPKMGGNPKGSAVSTPGYSQTVTALKAPAMNALVMGLDISGVSCGQTATSWEKNWTRWSLENLARDTGASVGGTPQVYTVRQNGTPGPASGAATTQCPAGANLGTVVTTAVQNMTNNLSQPVTLDISDIDDLTDFDGVTGATAGSNVLTPTNIDDATFVSSITVNPATGCTGPVSMASVVSGSGIQPAGYASCGPGAQPSISLAFRVPASVPLKTTPQIFKFQVKVLFGNSVMQTIPVVITVPPSPGGFVAADFVRDFDATSACNTGKRLSWGVYSWNVGPPCQPAVGTGNCVPLQSPPTVSSTTDSKISFYVTPNVGAGGTEIATPMFVARDATQTGAVDLGAFLRAQGITTPPTLVRVRANLAPTADQTKTPILANWGLVIDCTDAE